jgi:hypothetical protein
MRWLRCGVHQQLRLQLADKPRHHLVICNVRDNVTIPWLSVQLR